MVTGSKRRSTDLPQGGLEVPCLLKFEGPEDIVDKVRKRFTEMKRRQAVGNEVVVPGDNSKDSAQESSKGDCESKKIELMAMVAKEEAKVEVETKAAKEEPSKKTESLSSMTTWLQFNDIILKESDKHTIESSECLKDQHLNFAQRLLKHQYPKMNGLRLTLLQEQSHSQATSPALQVLHIKTNHWIVASTKEKGKAVHVYDSMYSSIDQATAHVIQTNFRCGMKNICLMPCQKQVGATDCGLFATAFATSIAFGEDPSSRSYCQVKMHAHLLTCFKNYHMELFP